MTEAQAYAKQWIDLQLTMGSYFERAALAKAIHKRRLYLDEIQKTLNEMQDVEKSLTVMLAMEPHQRIVISPGCILNMDANGQIGIEGVNKPETFGEIQQWT